MDNKYKKIWAAVLILILVLTGCDSGPEIVVSDISANPGTIVPAGEQIVLIVQVTGTDITYEWSSTRGTLSSSNSSSAIYTAPDTGGLDTVEVIILSDGQEVTRKSIAIDVQPPGPTPTPLPTPGPLTIANFDTCDNINNLHGTMGASYADSNTIELVETYPEEAGRGCVAALAYTLKDDESWAGFWLKLNGLDASVYTTLSFAIKSDTTSIPKEFKIEIKSGSLCAVKYVAGVTDQWEAQYTIPLSEFAKGDCGELLTSFNQLDELVFVFEASKAGGQTGTVYLDNIMLTP